MTKDSATISFVKEFDIIFEAVNTSIRKEGDENLESNKNNIWWLNAKRKDLELEDEIFFGVNA